MLRWSGVLVAQSLSGTQMKVLLGMHAVEIDVSTPFVSIFY